MKIVFVIPMAIDRPSGQRYFNIAKGMAAAGHSVRILALHADLARCTQRQFVQEGVEVWYAGQMHAMKRGTTPIRFTPWQLLRVVVTSTIGLIGAILASPAEIYHLGKPQPINGLAALIGITLLRRRAFYVDCDDDEVESNRLTAGWQRAVFAFWQRLIVTLAAGSTVNTLFLRERNLRNGRGEVLYVPNGVDLERFGRPPSRVVDGLRAALQLSDQRVIAYVGTLALQNHPVDLLLTAFAKVHALLPDVTLLLIGGGEDLALLREQVGRLQLEGSVIFTGHVDQRGLPQLLALAEFTVDPAHDDDVARARSPLKLFESLAMGIPVVTADVGDRALLLDGGKAGLLVKPGDARDLASGMLALLEDANRRSAAGEHGKALMATRYAWPLLAERWISLYGTIDKPAIADV